MKTKKLNIPNQMLSSEEAWPVLHIKTDEMNLQASGVKEVELVNKLLYEAYEQLHDNKIAGQTFIKVHIGEPKCDTRMKPLYVQSGVKWLKNNGATGVVIGDTTVAYTGARGHKSNPPGNCNEYTGLARRHKWWSDSDANARFVVLDRPSTSLKDVFSFTQQEKRIGVEGISRFNDFYLAGGFSAADFILNHAHLTLHGLAGVAGCVKSIAMGCSSLAGKLRMHQSLLPKFDAQLCVLCGRCVQQCPEDALHLDKERGCPVVDPQKCIGCGECEAVCATGKGAVHLEGKEITDWQRGQDTLSVRMADYTIGLMNERWKNVIHVLHMYSITERCDCIDMKQSPMIEKDLGFLAGKNPFAVDKLGAKILMEQMQKEGQDVTDPLLYTAEKTSRYVAENYGIITDVPLITKSPSQNAP